MRKKQYPDKVKKPQRRKTKRYKPIPKLLKRTAKALQDVKPIPIKKTTTQIINEEISIKFSYKHLPEQHSEIVSIENVSLLYKHGKKFISVSRYDDHDGTEFHRHETIGGKDMEYPIKIEGGPKKWLPHAISDFRKNYNKYITQFLRNLNGKNV